MSRPGEDEVDGPGPYTIATGRAIADHLGIPADINLSARLAQDPEGFKARLLAGRPQVILHRQTPTYGHFFLVHRRPTGAGSALEVYDSQATSGDILGELLHGEKDNGLNGPPGWPEG